MITSYITSSSKRLSANQHDLEISFCRHLDSKIQTDMQLPQVLTVKLNDFSRTFLDQYLQFQRLTNSAIMTILKEYKIRHAWEMTINYHHYALSTLNAIAKFDC